MKAGQEMDFVTQVTSLLLIHFLKGQTRGKKNVFGLKKRIRTLRSLVRFLAFC